MLSLALLTILMRLDGFGRLAAGASTSPVSAITSSTICGADCVKMFREALCFTYKEKNILVAAHVSDMKIYEEWAYEIKVTLLVISTAR